MKSISFWARRHPLKTQIFIAAAEVLLGWLGFWLGILVFIEGIDLPLWVGYLAGAGALSGVWVLTASRISYRTGRVGHSLILLGCLTIFAVSGHHLAKKASQLPQEQVLTSSTTLHQVSQAAPGYRAGSFVQHIRHRMEGVKAGRAAGFWLILAALASLVLSYFLAALTCGLICEEMIVLASFSALLGSGAIWAAGLLIGYAVIRFRKKEREITDKKLRTWRNVSLILLSVAGISLLAGLLTAVSEILILTLIALFISGIFSAGWISAHRRTKKP
ncbi:MAG: hypothetical protein EAZ89_17360 [Bacteroidetes bacterium]|nr:MAG: hypothetical protein EAZ89_17360 [Bacteroidota bacterium]